MIRPSGEEVARFSAAITARLGLRIDLDRSAELIGRRAEAHHESASAYLDRLDRLDPLDRVEGADARELRALIEALTVGETYFLRHIEQFRALADVAAPDRLACGPLRVLSAGCSSGEEPYTLAMVLRESCPGAAFEIHAVDLNPTAIARARGGRYARWSLRTVPAAFEQRWFRSDGTGAVVVPEIRAAVTFEAANVLDSAALATTASWDVVFCRNMMMYFAEDRADALIARLTRAIAPGGYLFLGHAEALRGRTDQFALCHTHGTFYYQRQASATTELTSPRVGSASTGSTTAALDAGWCEDIHAATRRIHALVDGALDQLPSRGSDEANAVTARREPRSTMTRDPAVARSELEAVRGLVAQERFGEALVRLDQLRAAGTVDRDTVMLRALVLTHVGQFADARTACAELLAIDNTCAGANYLLALCCDSTGDPDGAARMARLAIDLDPSFAMAHVHLGLLARRSGDRAIASRELIRAIALLEREPPARLALYGGGFSRQTLLGMCRAELMAIGAVRR